MSKPHPRIPTSTYRLQFNRQFTFAQARALVPYLHALGISDCYASPYFQARAESLHGYEITNHNKLNDAIGSREDYDAWVAELHAHGMGQVLDFVPNHMGIREPQNLWWADVLENGPSSAYAPYFDIDWQPLKADLRDKVLIPILGDQYGRVLERGELRVHFESGRFFLRYFEHEFPIAPGTYRHVLEIALAQLAGHKEEDLYAELQSIITALEYLPRRAETDPERIAERAREKEVIKRRLERRCQEAPLVQKAIEKALTIINGTPGDPRSFDALDALLSDRPIASLFGGWRRRKSITGASSISMTWRPSGWNCRRFLMKHIGCSSNWSRLARSRACGSIIRTVFICLTNISKNCSAGWRRCCRREVLPSPPWTGYTVASGMSSTPCDQSLRAGHLPRGREDPERQRGIADRLASARDDRLRFHERRDRCAG